MNNKKNANHSFKELVLLYHKNGLGDIAQTYSPEEENKFYSLVSSKLAKKYPQFIKYDQAYNLLKDNGSIVTTFLTDKRGFYDGERNIIGIKHFLNRLTTAIFHEIVHKLSYLISNGKILDLPEIYREAGTEYITSETLKTKNTKACVLDNVWGKFPNTISSYYLDYIFVRQLNTILGGDALEETILKGNLTFEKKIKEYFGESQYNSITQKLIDLNKNFFCYSAFYDVNSSKENKTLSDSILSTIESLQSTILNEGFDRKIKSAKTPEEAHDILNSLLHFSDLRLRRKENEEFIDEEFKRYFNNAKHTFSTKFPESQFTQEFTPNDWQKKYPDFKKIVQITPEELKLVRKLGKENYKKCKGTFFSRIFGNKSSEIQTQPLSPTQNFQDLKNFDGELKVQKLNKTSTNPKSNIASKQKNSKNEKPYYVE